MQMIQNKKEKRKLWDWRTLQHYCPVCGHRTQTKERGNVSTRVYCFNCNVSFGISTLMLVEKIV